MLGSQEELPGYLHRWHLLADYADAASAAVVLLRHDHRWRRVGSHRPRSESWKGYYQGLRPNQVHTPVDGIDAFPPAQLSSSTVDGLLNGSRPDQLADGIRLRRATDAQGTDFQEVRFETNQGRPLDVDIQHGEENRVGAWTIDGTNGSGGTTASFGSGSGFNRVVVDTPSNQGYRAGFAYGSGVVGSTDSDAYLWSYNDGWGGARPFTQMWIRPQVTVAGMNFAPIPDSGTAKQEQRSQVSSYAEPRVWGVTGLANGDSGELDSEVQAFAQVGDTVFVGGNFRYVQRDRTSTGADQVDQPYLAGFDVNSGELIQTFRPALDGQVKALVSLPGNRLAVGGEFTTVNGSPHLGFVQLDAASGQVAGWQIDIENRIIGGAVQVRGFDTQSGHLYIAGEFTHLTGDNGLTASSWNGAKVDWATGAVDRSWQPLINGVTVGVDASAANDRVYFSGYFKHSGSLSTPSMTALVKDTAQVVTPVWSPTFSKSGVNGDGEITGNVWQLGIKEVAGRVYVAGSEHSLFGYQRDDFSLVSGSITKVGGDFQTVNASNDTVYAGCHCGDWVYEDAYTWSNVGNAWTHADKITLVGAWDAATGDVLPDFGPVLTARRGYGVWATFIDSSGALWVGGDLDTSEKAESSRQWSGGFARFPLRDSTAPTTPTSLTEEVVASDLRLSWSGSTDNSGSVSYEVLRDDRVVAVTSATEAVLPAQTTSARYFVRAVDGAGNRSASTHVLVVSAAPETATLISEGSAWNWRFDATAPPADWRDPEFDDSEWPTGSAVLGFGTPDLSTDIGVGAPSPRPLAAQFRQEFNIDDASAIAEGGVTVIADDGVVVYVNGTEVGRSNLPTGPISSSTYATAAPTAFTAANSPAVFVVPGGLLNTGTNVVAAETHLNYRSTRDASFDLRLEGVLGTPPPPVAPSVAGESLSFDTVNLTWTDPPTTTAVEYRISRDGSLIASVPAPDHEYTDVDLEANTTYAYSVIGVDALGRVSTPGSTTVTTQPQPPPPPLVSNLSTWSWRYADSEPDPGWTAVGYDDGDWASGSALLGFGSNDIATDISEGAPSPRPLAAQFRHVFDIEDPAAFASAMVTAIADDGVIVYLNGIEIGRANLPSGPITTSTWATAAPRTRTAEADRVTFTIPVSAFVAGPNVITAETHLNYRSTRDASFDLRLEGVLGTPPPPVAPSVAGESLSFDTVNLTWTDPPTTTAVEYRISRDGSLIASVPAPDHEYTDVDLEANTTYAYSVIGVDALGRVSTPGSTTVTTQPQPPPPPLVSNLSTWSWRYADSDRTRDGLRWATTTATGRRVQLFWVSDPMTSPLTSARARPAPARWQPSSVMCSTSKTRPPLRPRWSLQSRMTV